MLTCSKGALGDFLEVARGPEGLTSGSPPAHVHSPLSQIGCCDLSVIHWRRMHN